MSRRPYKGQFTNFTNPKKYLGDIENCIYRSSWERNAFRWCDLNEDIVEWASEELSLYYTNPITGRKHKYYPDLFIVMQDGTKVVVEIKPKNQTMRPETPVRKTKRFVEATQTYITNLAKWEAAEKVCAKNNFKFQIWTEETLEALGIYKMQVDNTTLLKEKGEMKRRAIRRSKTPTRPKRRS